MEYWRFANLTVKEAIIDQTHTLLLDFALVNTSDETPFACHQA